MLNLSFKKPSIINIICIAILNLLIQSTYTGDTLLLSKELSEQKETTVHYDTLDTSYSFYQEESQKTSMVQISDTKGRFSLVSALKGLAKGLYEGTKYAVKHPGKALTLGLVTQVLAATALNAKQQVGYEFQINQGTAGGVQLNPVVAVLTNENVFVAWAGKVGTYDFNIYGRIFFSNGTALDKEFQINQLPGALEAPEVASLPNGNVFVAWAGNDIYGRVFLPNGTPLDDEFQINNQQMEALSVSSIAALPNGNVFVLWIDGYEELYGRVFFSNGTALDNNMISIYFGSPLNPLVISLANGNALVIWWGLNEVSNNCYLYGQAFFSNGTALGHEFYLNQTAGGKTSPLPHLSVSRLANDNVFVAWEGTDIIYGRVFSPSGTSLINEFVIESLNNGGYPSVVSLPNGNLFATWEDGQTGSTSFTNIYGRVILPNGTALDNEFQINHITFGDQTFQSVASFLNGNVIVVWQDNQAENIYGCIVSLSSSNQSTWSTLAISTTTPTITQTSQRTSESSELPTSLTEDSSSSTIVLSSSNLWSSPTSSSETSKTNTTIQTSQGISESSNLPESLTGDSSSNTILSPSINSFSTSSTSVSQTMTNTQITQGSSGTAQSSTGDSDKSSWKTIAIIGGGVGGTVVAGAVGYIGLKKCLANKRNKLDYALLGQTEENPNQPLQQGHISSPFDVTYKGFTEHPTFVGKIHGYIYEIWKTLNREEAMRLRPLTSMPVPDLEKIKFTLGHGHFGAIYAGSNPQTEEIYAIKEVYGRESVDESLREGEIVHSLGDYPHIMTLVDYIHFEPSYKSRDPRLFQVMPLAYINGLGFKEKLEKIGYNQREKVVSDSFRQMMLGLDYLHKKGVVHMDIKADNTLYMKDGTLRIADFGRANYVGENDQIADMYALGDVRKFSPEIVAFIRKRLGGNYETVDSVSGKPADIWAAGLFVWELLEDNTDSLFSLQGGISLKKRAAHYTYEAFEKLVENINFLNSNYSPTLLNLLHQVLMIDPTKRINTVQVIRELSALVMSDGERKAAFEELIRLATDSAIEEQPTVPVYSFANPDLYVKKVDQQQSPTYVPSDLYAKQTTDPDAAEKELVEVLNYPSADPAMHVMRSKDQKQSSSYVPSNFYAKE